jgi:hypothetical protein
LGRKVIAGLFVVCELQTWVLVIINKGGLCLFFWSLFFWFLTLYFPGFLPFLFLTVPVFFEYWRTKNISLASKIPKNLTL